MAERVIWENGVKTLQVVADHPSFTPSDVLAFDMGEYIHPLTLAELKSLITALINYEAELERTSRKEHLLAKAKAVSFFSSNPPEIIWDVLGFTGDT